MYFGSILNNDGPSTALISVCFYWSNIKNNVGVRAAFKIVAANLEARSFISSSVERTARLAAKCQKEDLYISLIINFSGRECQMKRTYT